MSKDYPYEIISPSGQPMMEAPESCRYPSGSNWICWKPDTPSGSMERKSQKRKSGRGWMKND